MSVQVLPVDRYNEELVANAHPSDWVNPSPSAKYNLVVIGAGTAGLVSAAGAAGLGAKVALVERGLMGGDCLNVGCVPSKALIRASRAVAEVRHADQFGVRIPEGVEVDFPAVMERMRRLRTGISPHDSAQRFMELGIDVFLGQATFTGEDTVEVNGSTLNFSRCILATGARAARPKIPGLEDVGFLTNETVFSLTELPQRLAVIGAGPIGCELAQAFARFGAEVHLIHRSAQILHKEDPRAAEIAFRSLKNDGIHIYTECETDRVERDGAEKRLFLKCGESQQQILVDEILVGVGRQPNVDGLGLEAANVQYDPREGVDVDDRLRTSNKRIYAAGDICTKFKFTHAADAMARIAIRNSLFMGGATMSSLIIPRCTYTDPEIAAVGLTEQGARQRGVDYDVFEQDLAHVDRAILDGESEGFAKILVKKGSDRILGATIVAAHAGEMISEVTLAMHAGYGLKKLANVIHPYPTQAEAIKKIADAYNRTRLTATLKWLFSKWLAWRH